MIRKLRVLTRNHTKLIMCNGFDLKVLVGINYPRDVNNTRVTMYDELDLENFSKGIQI